MSKKVVRWTRPRGGAKLRRVRVGSGAFAVATQGDLSVVYWGTVVVGHFRRGDTLGRYAVATELVKLHEQRPTDVARATGIPRRTLYRLLARYEEGGVDALAGREPPGKQPTKIGAIEARRLLSMKRRGVSHREAARRLGVSLSGVANALKRLRWKPAEIGEERSVAAGADTEAGSVPSSTVVADDVASATTQLVVDEGSGATAPASAAPATVGDVVEDTQEHVTECPVAVAGDGSATFDTDPHHRWFDRMMARLGLLRDAAPLFASGERISHAGAFLAVPLLVGSGVFDVTKKLYGTPKAAFYGIRTCVLLFTLMALLRVKRVEGLKEEPPGDLGQIIGLDRAPEVKTVRRKLREMAELGRGLELMRDLAQVQVKQSDCFGYLYVDGHVRVYSGKRDLPKTYVMQRKLALPATTDYWVNCTDGNPLLVVTAEANEGMTTMLPLVLKEVRQVIGERRVTIAFDRGGWSPKLFAELIADNWHILTYRKGKSRRVPLKSFHEYTGTIEGRQVTYKLAEKRIRLRGCRSLLRQVTMLADDGYQTQIVTSDDRIAPVEVAYRMFDRWRQENFFKYMLSEYGLDALVDYRTEPADPTRTVPNPKRKKLTKQIAAARAALTELQRQYGEAVLANPESVRPTVRGFKIANGAAIGKPLRLAADKVDKLIARRSKLPARVAVSETLNGKQPTRLHTETKRITDIFKSVAYRAETGLLSLLRPHYPRADDEGRTLLASALRSSGSLTVTAGELRVTLNPMTSPHKSRAIQALCDQLNKRRCNFPGSNLRLHLCVKSEVEICANE